ncbi:MAG: hypothetical protein ACUVX9_11610 [Anaerolineae bacterium]
MTMFDIWTYMQGVTDEKGNPKLGYFVARSLCQPVVLSGLHGSVTLATGDPIEIKASNTGQTLVGCTLHVRLADVDGRTVETRQWGGLSVDGDVRVTSLARLETSPLQAGLYRLEMILLDDQGMEQARSLELFHLRTAGHVSERI